MGIYYSRNRQQHQEQRYDRQTAWILVALAGLFAVFVVVFSERVLL